MDRMRRAQVALLLVLCIGLMGQGCDNWREKAAIFMRDYATTLEAVQNAEIDAHRANYVSDVDHQVLQNYVLKLAVYGKEANDAIGRGNRQGAIVQIDLALADLDRLQKQGLLGVKNPESKAAISALVLSVRGVLTGAKVQLQ